MGSPEGDALRVEKPTRSPSAAAAAVLLLLSGACSDPQQGAKSGSGILLVAIDGLRADHLTCLGYDRPTTPRLDALAAEGALFEEAFAAAPWNLPSHAALLSGLDPNAARRIAPQFEASVEHRWHVPRDGPLLAVELLIAGYATAAFMDHPWMGERYGFKPGFQHFQEARPAGRRSAAHQTDALRAWLRSVPAKQDWFGYLHLADLERVWTEPDPAWDRRFQPRPELSSVPPVSNNDTAFFAIPRSRWRGETLTLGEYEARYDGGLAKLDAELGRLFDILRQDGRWERTTVVVVGTHGVQFGEAGLILDHGMLYPPDLHVPWILRPAAHRAQPAMHRVESMASLVDVMPTLLELEGLTPPELVLGVSQLDVLDGSVPEVREYAFASCGLQQGFAAYGKRLSSILVLPGVGPDEQLRESWFGELQAEARGPVAGGLVELTWDRSIESYPELTHHVSVQAAGQDRTSLSAASAQWLTDVERTSSALRSAAWAQERRGFAELFSLFDPFGGDGEE